MEYTSYMYEVTKEQTQSFLKKKKLKNKKASQGGKKKLNSSQAVFL